MGFFFVEIVWSRGQGELAGRTRDSKPKPTYSMKTRPWQVDMAMTFNAFCGRKMHRAYEDQIPVPSPMHSWWLPCPSPRTAVLTPFPSEVQKNWSLCATWGFSPLCKWIPLGPKPQGLGHGTWQLNGSDQPAWTGKVLALSPSCLRGTFQAGGLGAT